MTSKHTPGPWELIPPRPYDGDDDDLQGSFYTPGGIEGADGSPVCLLGDPSGSGTMFENAANARLIAAAPDLLEAAQEFQRLGLVILSAVNFADGANLDEVTRALNSARAAIAKATQEPDQ